MFRFAAALAVASALSWSSAGFAQDRFPEIPRDAMSPAQRAWADEIAKPPRNAKTTLPPYKVYLYSPDFARLATNMSGYLRWNTTLSPRISEFAILIVARHWSSDYEWLRHYPLAVAGGLDPKIPAAMARGDVPTGLKPDEQAMYDLCTELLGGKKVSDKTFNSAVQFSGKPAIVDVVGLMGYYGVSAMATMVSEYQTPDDPNVPRLQPIP